MPDTRVLVYGQGSWGRRVASALRRLDEFVVQVEPLSATPRTLDVVEAWAPTHAVVAVPPFAHLDAALGVLDRFESLTDVRLEKPGCENEDDLLDVLAAGDRRDVQVSVGHTVAAMPAHYAARMAAGTRGGVVRVDAVRCSSSLPRHDVSPLLDLGAHAACAAVLAGCPLDAVSITCSHHTGEDVRVTEYEYEDGTVARVDEVAGLATLAGVDAAIPIPRFDALAYELAAFVMGDPLVMGETAIDVHRVLAAQGVAA